MKVVPNRASGAIQVATIEVTNAITTVKPPRHLIADPIPVKPPRIVAEAAIETSAVAIEPTGHVISDAVAVNSSAIRIEPPRHLVTNPIPVKSPGIVAEAAIEPSAVAVEPAGHVVSDSVAVNSPAFRRKPPRDILPDAITIQPAGEITPIDIGATHIGAEIAARHIRPPRFRTKRLALLPIRTRVGTKLAAGADVRAAASRGTGADVAPATSSRTDIRSTASAGPRADVRSTAGADSRAGVRASACPGLCAGVPAPCGTPSTDRSARRWSSAGPGCAAGCFTTAASSAAERLAAASAAARYGTTAVSAIAAATAAALAKHIAGCKRRDEQRSQRGTCDKTKAHILYASRVNRSRSVARSRLNYLTQSPPCATADVAQLGKAPSCSVPMFDTAMVGRAVQPNDQFPPSPARLLRSYDRRLG